MRRGKLIRWRMRDMVIFLERMSEKVLKYKVHKETKIR